MAECVMELKEKSQDGSSHDADVAKGYSGPVDGVPQKPFTTLSAMATGHQITNSAVSIILVVSSNVMFGGSPLFFWGYLAMAVVGLCTATSLAELCSMIPHSGGQYAWVTAMAPDRRFLVYLTAVFSWAGAVCTCASATLVFPQQIFQMVQLTHPDFEYQPWMMFLAYVATALFAFGFNLFERILPWIGRFFLTWTLLSMGIIFVCLLAHDTPKQSAYGFFVELYNTSGWPDGLAFLIGVNGMNWAFSCLDAACHLVDEIPDPRRNIPKALMWTIVVGTVSGTAIIIAIFLAATDMDSDISPLLIFFTVFNENVHAAIGLQCLVLVSSLGAVIGIHTWQSRLAWAFSRDGGFPFAKLQGRLAPAPFHTPIYAHVYSVIWTILLGVIYLGSQTAFGSFVSGGILCQYISYSIPITLLLFRRHNAPHGPFWFSKLGYVANLMTLAWTVVALVIYSFPYYTPVVASEMNYVSCVLVFIFFYAVAYWVFIGKSSFKVPDVQRV